MNQEPFVTIPLRDGAQVSVGRDGVRVGERLFAVAAIQDARQVVPDPETIALRVANERHVVEFQPAHPGDGALALEAIFRMRPELRPAGFEAPAAIPASFPPLSPPPNQQAAPGPWAAHPSWPPHPGMYVPAPPVTFSPPPAYGPPPGISDVSGVSGITGGRLTPYPRSAGELIGAVFELFLAHWRRWLLLAVIALLLPEMVSGIVNALFHVLSGADLWAGVPFAAGSAATNGNAGVPSAGLPSNTELLLDALDLLITSALGALIAGWSAAALGIASRDALFGRAPQIRATLRAGFSRLFPAMIASLIGFVLTLLILAPIIILYVILIARFGSALMDPTTIDQSSPAASALATLSCLWLILLIPCVALAIYVGIRLAVAPYIAATEPLGPVAAVRKSWRLTYGQWWHTCLPIVVFTVLARIITLPAIFVQYASFGVSALIALPLVIALAAPLVALAAVVVLYDLRLRREGYAILASEGSADDERAPASI